MTPRSSHRVAGAALAVLVLAGCSGEGEPEAPVGSTAAPTGTGGGGSTSPSPLPSPSESTSESAGPTAAEVFRTARAAALAAESGRVTGSVRHEGKILDIDVEGAADGGNQRVLITTEGAGTSEVVMADGRYWLGGDEAFWAEQTGDPGAGREMVGKYVAIDESAATELGSYSLGGVLNDFFGHPLVSPVLESDRTPAAETALEGRPAFLIGREGGARLWVAADGSGMVLRAEGPPGAPTDLVFSDWGRARTFTPPPASAVVEG